MLSQEELAVWYDRLKLSEQARNLIQGIRSSPPSRRVRSSARNVSGQYPSQKMGMTIQFESHHNELAAILDMEFDEDVLEYYDQPSQIKLEYIGKNGRRIGYYHIPDYFVSRQLTAGWEECKTETSLIELAQKKHNFYIHQGGDWRCPPGELYAERFGLYYHIRSDRDIDWVKHRNISFLEDYFCDDSFTVADDAKEVIHSIVARERGITLESLLQQITVLASSDDIYRLIAIGDIYVNLSAVSLTDAERVRVYLDRETASAYSQIAQTPKHKANNISLFVNVAVNTIVEWDGKGLTIINLGQTRITLRGEDGNLVSIPRSEFEDLVSKGEITGIPAEVETTQQLEMKAILNAAHPEDLQEANRRHSLVQAHILGEPSDEKVPGRTLRHYVSSYRKAEAIYGVGYIGLLPQKRYRGNRNRKLPEETLTLMIKYIEDGYENPTQKTKFAVYGSLLQACEQRGLPSPSYRTFSLEINRRPRYQQVLRRQGKRAAYQHAGFYWVLEQTTPRHGDRPYEVCHIDHTQLDIELVDSKTNTRLGRPWATIMTDAFSRQFLAVYLTYDPPSYRSCMMVLRECVRRTRRFPQTIVVDGGREFSSIYFETLLAMYKCTKKTRPPAKPRSGSVCERLFGTTNTRFIHNLTGNTQITRNVREVTKSINPKNLAIWTLGSLYQFFCQFAYEVYDTTPHPALGQSPRQACAAAMARTGMRPSRIIVYDENFRMLTLPTTPKGKAKVLPSRGVKINNRFYWCDDFRNPSVEKTDVPIRYDPDNAGIAYAYVHNRWILCYSEYHANFDGRSEKEIKLATEELHKRCKQHSRDFKVTAKAVAKFLESAEAEQKLLTQRLRDRENKDIIALIDGRLSSNDHITEPNVWPSTDENEVRASDDPVDEDISLRSIELYEEF